MNQVQVCICHFPGCTEKVFIGVFCTPHFIELRKDYAKWLDESVNTWYIDLARGTNRKKYAKEIEERLAFLEEQSRSLAGRLAEN